MGEAHIASITVKAGAFKQAIETTENTDGDWASKVQFLATQFKQPLVENLLQTAMSPFFKLGYLPLFSYIYISCLTRNHMALNQPGPNATAAQILNFRKGDTFCALVPAHSGS
jgi:hypothetical protein